MEDLRSSISAFESLDDESLHDGIETMELVRNAHRMYLQQSSSEKRNLLKNLLSNSSWKDGKLSVEFRQPYDMIANTKKLHDMKKAAGELPGGLYPIWRAVLDAFRLCAHCRDDSARQRSEFCFIQRSNVGEIIPEHRTERSLKNCPCSLFRVDF